MNAKPATSTPKPSKKLRTKAEYRTLRRRWLAWTVPIVAALTLIGAKFIVQDAIAAAVVSSYSSKDYEESLNRAGQLLFLNVVETWKPDFDMGTNFLQIEALDEAEAAFTRALPLAGAIDQCPIRANLSITIEREGDALARSNDTDGAREQYLRALEVITGRDAGCANTDDEPSLLETEQRLLQKLQDDPPPEQGDGGGDEQEDQPDDPAEDLPQDDRLGELQDDLEQNQGDREDQEREDDGGSGGGYDRPW